MARHRVILDKGVTIGDRKFGHGSVVDSERLVRDLRLPMEPPAGASEEAIQKHNEKVAAMTDAHEQLTKRAAADFDGNMKAGNFEDANDATKEG